MKEIYLTQGKVALVDDEDYERLSLVKWFASNHHNTWYAKRIVYSANRRTPVYMHRLIMDAPPGAEVDHRDHDGLNNLRSNLRLATHTQNQKNMRVPKHNTSGYKGVHFHKGAKKWRAVIRDNGKLKHLGFFAVLEEAVQVRRAAAEKLHGEFAYTGPPQEDST